MSLIYDLQQLQEATKRMEEKAEQMQRNYRAVMDGLVEWQQECRMAKNYHISDRIRQILGGVGVKIVQGAAGLPRDQWGNRQLNDFWRQQ